MWPVPQRRKKRVVGRNFLFFFLFAVVFMEGQNNCCDRSEASLPSGPACTDAPYRGRLSRLGAVVWRSEEKKALWRNLHSPREA